MADAMEHPAHKLKQASKSKWLERIGVATGVVALVVSFGTAAISFRTLNHSIRDSANQDQRTRYEAVSAKLLDRDSALVEHPQLIGYFWDGNPVPPDTDPNKQIVEAIATQRVDFDEYAYTELANMGQVRPTPMGGFKRMALTMIGTHGAHCS
jgi:hypothetical protein